MSVPSNQARLAPSHRPSPMPLPLARPVLFCAVACALVPALARPAAAQFQGTPATSAAATDHGRGRAGADSTLQFRLEIPSQPLPGALEALARLTGLRIDLAVASEVTLAPTSRRLAGRMTAPQALRALLDGTPLRARFRDAGWVVISPAARSAGDVRSLERVVVSAAAARGAYTARRSSSATRTDTPLRDVPQAVTIVGSGLIADQAMQSMADVVRYIPGITIGQGEGHRDAPTIRGNATTSDFFVDGVRDDAQYLRDVYNVERVEALKGANAIAFGRGGGGGVLNRVSKEAQFTPRRTLTLEGGSFGHRRATLDAGDRLTGNVALRLNGVLEDSRQFRDGTELARVGINPTATLLAGSTIVRLGYEYFRDRRVVDRGIPSFRGAPSDAAITTFFGHPKANHASAEVHAAVAAVERPLPGGGELRNRTRFTRYDKFYRNVVPGAVNAAGTSVSLSAYDNGTERSNVFNQTDLTYRVRTGSLGHTLLVGGELGRQVTDNLRHTGYFNDSTTTLAVPFAQPVLQAPVTYRQSATDADNRTTANVASAYVQDQVAIGRHLEAMVGVRYDRFDLDFHDNRAPQELQRTDAMVSPRAGLVVKPAEPISVYGSYGVSYLPGSGEQFASLTATTQALRPEAFHNREVGVKWEPRADLAITTALYRLDRSNTTAPSPNDPSVTVQTGRQRTTGMELGVAGYLASGWQVAGGWATQRARIVSRTSAARAGASVPLVPRHTFSLWNRVNLTGTTGAGIGLVHQGASWAAIDNTVRLPGFTRVDAALFLPVVAGLRAQVNVENLLDRRYYATSHGNNNILPGAPRTIRVSLTTAP